MAKKHNQGSFSIVPATASVRESYSSQVSLSIGSAHSAGLPNTATSGADHSFSIQGPTDCQGVPSKAIDVARYLMRLAAAEAEPEFLTHMRLQKLLYYVQGWSLALRNKPMFPERIEAWAHGPVVPEVYARFANYGDKPIASEMMNASGQLSSDERELIEGVWESYKGFATTSLRSMTHKESPWTDARGKSGPADRRTTEITQNAMKQFFVQASKNNAKNSKV